jgi:DNA-binding beta-propeller fold protein YncE
VGPTGVAYSSSNGMLYVADTAANRISAIPNAATRMDTAFTGADLTANGRLNSPLGLVLAPDGHLISVNAGNGLAVETGPGGRQLAHVTLDHSGSPAGAGALFGLAIGPSNTLYYVDDATNTLNLLH